MAPEMACAHSCRRKACSACSGGGGAWEQGCLRLAFQSSPWWVWWRNGSFHVEKDRQVHRKVKLWKTQIGGIWKALGTSRNQSLTAENPLRLQPSSPLTSRHLPSQEERKGSFLLLSLPHILCGPEHVLSEAESDLFMSETGSPRSLNTFHDIDCVHVCVRWSSEDSCRPCLDSVLPPCVFWRQTSIVRLDDTCLLHCTSCLTCQNS